MQTHNKSLYTFRLLEEPVLLQLVGDDQYTFPIEYIEGLGSEGSELGPVKPKSVGHLDADSALSYLKRA